MTSFPLADHFIHLDDESGRIRVLNHVAATMLSLTNDGLSAEAVAFAVSRQYEVDLATAIKDVELFLHEFQAPDAALLEELEGYTPNTDFKPLRKVEPVETVQLKLPGCTIAVSSELSGLCDLLSEMFTLASSVVEPVQSVSLNIFNVDSCYPIVADGQTLDTGLTLEDAAIKCLREINGLIARSQDWTCIFHASAVARDNSAVLMPALGGSGKTTLAAYLMHRGFTYLNDDSVPLLAHSAELLPVPVCLSIKEGSWPVLTEYFPRLGSIRHFGPIERRLKYLPPEDAQIQLRPVPCRLLIIPEYNESHQGTEVVRLSEVDVFGKLIQSGCIIAQPVQAATLEALVSWLDEMPCYRLVYSTLEGIDTVISELLRDVSDS